MLKEKIGLRSAELGPDHERTSPLSLFISRLDDPAMVGVKSFPSRCFDL